MGSPMERATGGVVELLGRLPWPTHIILGALTVVGAVTMVRWIISIFAVLITLLMILVVLVALAWLALTGRLRR
ncbi:MAG: hypothetical protein F4Z54_00150 [Acidimicrobiaceae bacterium]|nr:hypothetical protein [Acidimicrobiaceae bacterium]